MRAGPLGYLKLFLTDHRKPWPDWVDGNFGPPPAEAVNDDRIRYTFVNHSTVLLQTAGLNILTDPIWSYRCSPFSWIGPRRFRNPGIRFQDLPPIHCVLISHNHYDHMDIPTLRRLQQEFTPEIFVGAGNGDYLQRKGIYDARDLSWWQEAVIGKDVQVTFVPAQHWSGRGLFDRNRTLWGGFVIETKSRVIYFAGDTGYSSHFQDVRKRIGPPHISFLPIGAYEPRSFMCAAHMNPREAVEAHLDLQSAMSVGIHFGAFRLSFEGINDPERDLIQARSQAGLAEDEFVIPQHGGARELQVYPSSCARSGF